MRFYPGAQYGVPFPNNAYGTPYGGQYYATLRPPGQPRPAPQPEGGAAGLRHGGLQFVWQSGGRPRQLPRRRAVYGRERGAVHGRGGVRGAVGLPGDGAGAGYPPVLGTRFYDARTGRFLTRDPIGYGGGINLYGFAGNNPVTQMDPLGLDHVDDAIDRGMTILGAGVGVLGGGTFGGAGGTLGSARRGNPCGCLRRGRRRRGRWRAGRPHASPWHHPCAPPDHERPPMA